MCHTVRYPNYYFNYKHFPPIDIALAILATTTGSEHANVATLTNTLSELTAFTQSQVAELQRLAGGGAHLLVLRHQLMWFQEQ
jgi:hypothetical protein